MDTHGEKALLLCFNRLVGFLDERGVIRREEFADSLAEYADAYGGVYALAISEVAEQLRPAPGPVLKAIDGDKQDDDEGPDAA